jgi:uncharacterized protein YwqG
MTTDQKIKRLEPWLAKHRRPAWRPVVKEGDGPATASKFCGSPWIGPDAPWPNCGRCEKALQLFLQLDLGKLPKGLGRQFGAGLLQLFYCTRDHRRGGWQPPGLGGRVPSADDLSRVRIIQPTGRGRIAPVSKPKGRFPAKRIVGWKRFLDLPDPDEQEGLGLKYIHDSEAGTVRLECQELGLVVDGIKDDTPAWKIADSQAGDKLAGWPSWIQNVQYPNCPRCGRRMVHVFQVDSQDNIPFMFGDAGCGYIFQCPEHKDVVVFDWSCW